MVNRGEEKVRVHMNVVPCLWNAFKKFLLIEKRHYLLAIKNFLRLLNHLYSYHVIYRERAGSMGPRVLV